MARNKHEENMSQGSTERKAAELAAMDWANIPSAEVSEHFGGVTFATLAHWRAMPIYIDTLGELQRAWQEEITKLPSTADLKKKINHAMALAVDVLIHTLAGRACVKDKISAARLAAQLDGRFLGADEGPGRLNPQTETLADALLTEIKKTRETIQ